jgi:hypothetical protein
MQETPIQVLEKKIKYYENFKRTCETREGIIKNENEPEEETKKKFDGLIKECDAKIKEFKIAISTLERYNKIKNYIDNYPETKIE